MHTCSHSRERMHGSQKTPSTDAPALFTFLLPLRRSLTGLDLTTCAGWPPSEPHGWSTSITRTDRGSCVHSGNPAQVPASTLLTIHSPHPQKRILCPSSLKFKVTYFCKCMEKQTPAPYVYVARQQSLVKDEHSTTWVNSNFHSLPQYSLLPRTILLLSLFFPNRAMRG